MFPRIIQLKNQEILTIREATRADAEAMIQYVKTVGDETNFLTFSSSEFNKTVEEEVAIIEAHHEADNQIFLLALIDHQIVGMLNVVANAKSRLRHIGEFGTSVLKAHWRKGIGGHLLQSMIDWAEASGVIRKINLVVLANNSTARHLYQKFGFEEEGLARRASYQDGQFIDAYLMGMLIN